MSTITTHSPKTPASFSTEGVVPSYVLQLSEVESRIGEKNNKVEIGSQPVMIGSGPRCTLRVDTLGTKPVHCVVSLGKEGPVVRRWAAETLLNGEAFTEALLAEGDRLSIGTVDVEIHRLDEADQPLAKESSPQKPSPVDPSENFDPAVPQHLLTPWTASKSEEETAESEETPEQTTDPVEKSVEESACESQSEISDWIGGESEWTVADEATTNADEEGTSEEVINVEAGNDELSTDPWTIELAPVDELTPSTLDESEMSSEPLISEEVNAWVTDSVSEELFQISDVESENSDPFADPVVDTETEEPAATSVEEISIGISAEADSDDTITALRSRLTVRADRLRSVIQTFRTERSEREQQEVIAVETVALVEQLQADLARVEQQASDDAGSLADLQKELSAANDLIDTFEASLHDAIESASGVVYQEPLDPVVDTLVEAEGEPVAEEEPPLWTDTAGEVPLDVAPVDQGSASSEEVSEPVLETGARDSKSEVEAPIATEDLWGIEHLATEESVEESIVYEEPLIETTEETLSEMPVEAFVEAPNEERNEELSEVPTGSLDDVLLPGETAEKLPTEPEAVSAPETEEPTEAPTEAESFIDRYAHVLPEDKADESALSESSALPKSMEPEPALADVLGNEEGEESLDDYMKKMMNRIRGDGAPAAVALKAPQPVKVKATPVAAPVADETAAPELKQAPLQNLDELKRNPTRELGADLGELRQLANQSARRAIDVSETNNKKEHAAMRLTVAGIGATCGLLACMTAPSVIDWQFYAGLVGVVGGGYLGFRTIKVIQHSAALKAAAENEVTAPAI